MQGWITYPQGASFFLPMARGSSSDSSESTIFSDDLPATSAEVLLDLFGPLGRIPASASSDAALFPLRGGFSSSSPTSSLRVAEAWVSWDRVT